MFEKSEQINIPKKEQAVESQKERKEEKTVNKAEDISNQENLIIESKEKGNPIKERLLKLLEEEGILRHIAGFNVIDLETIKNRKLNSKLLSQVSFTKDKKTIYAGPTLLFEALADYKVISKEDFSKTKNKIERQEAIKEIPLFNIPESAEDAFDLEKMKNKKYYLNFWDLYSQDKHPGTPFWSYDMTAQNGEKINTRELALATGIFRDHNGKRNERGELVVFDKEKNDYVKVSAQWVVEHIGSFGKKGKNAKTVSFATPAPFLLTYCQNLLAKGFVKLEDFRQKTGDKSGNLMRKEFYPDSREFSANIDGVRYYLGREKYFIFNKEKIPTEYLKAVVLDDRTAGIVEIAGKKEILRFTLDLLSDEEKKEKRALIEEKRPGSNVQQITALTVVGKKEISNRINPWRATKDNPPMKDESYEDYAERIININDFDFIKQLSKDFQKEQIGIHKLTWREQQWLGGAAYHLGREKPKLLEFGKKYGLNGLKTFLSCEYDLANSEGILDLGKNLKKESADAIFSKYSEIADLAYQVEKELSESIKDKEKTEKVDSKTIAQDILRRGKDILADFSRKAQKAKKEGREISVAEILSDLQDYHRDLVFQAAAIKEGKKEGLKFEDFEGARYRVMTAKEVAKEKELFGRMHEYYRRNWERKPSIQASALKNFDAKIERGREDVIFFVFERNGELAAFSGAEKAGPKKTHFFGFNVNPAMQGSKIGWDLKEASIEFFEEGKAMEDDPIIKIFGMNNDIEIECDPTDPKSTPVYVEKDGYVVTGTNHEFGDDLIFEAVKENSPGDYYFRKKSDAEVVEEYIKKNMGNKFSEGDERVVLKFVPGSAEMKQMTEKLLNQDHYRITKYFFGIDGKTVYCGFEKPATSAPSPAGRGWGEGGLERGESSS